MIDRTPPVRAADGLFSPLDEALGLLPGHVTPLLHQHLVQLGTLAKSFAEAALVFRCVVGTDVSEPTSRRYTERLGAVMDACEMEDAATDSQDDPDDPRPHWVGADGVFLRLVGGGYREVRTVTIGRVNPARKVGNEERVTTTDLTYYSRLTDGADVFIERAGNEFRRRGVGAARLAAAGSDGADWCQKLFGRHCPNAWRSLDFFHAGQRVSTFVKAVWPDNPVLQKERTQEHWHRLKHEGPGQLVATLTQWSHEGWHLRAKEAATEQLAYFTPRLHLMDYPGLRAAGLPIGTGNAESANLHVIQDRLKGPGKFWAERHVNPMLALRCAVSSKRWDAAWSQAASRISRDRTPIHEACASHAKT